MDRVRVASGLAGAFLVAEAAVSPFVSGERAYHALNVPLSLAVVAALLLFLRGHPLGRLARVGAWMGVVLGSVSALGGLYPAIMDASPGWAEAITHTATLFTFLSLALFAGGLLRDGRVARAGAATLLLAAGGAVALALIGFDDPWVFAGPEALAGIGLAWAGWSASGRGHAPA